MNQVSAQAKRCICRFHTQLPSLCFIRRNVTLIMPDVTKSVLFPALIVSTISCGVSLSFGKYSNKNRIRLRVEAMPYPIRILYNE